MPPAGDRTDTGPRPGPVHRLDPASFPLAAAEWTTRAVEEAIQERGHCALALAGGGTPKPIYERMARAPLADRIDWPRVSIYFGDERGVPPDDPASNFGMAREMLLERVPIQRQSIHRMEGEREDREAAARAYEEVLPDRFDVLLLGMGEDGHTASLFPHSPAIAERERLVVPVLAPARRAARLTITPPVIRAAERVIVVVAGAGKAVTVARALADPYVPDELPVQLARDGTWFIDSGE